MWKRGSLMPDVLLEKVRKEFGGGVVAVRDVTLRIPEGEFMCLLGPSGSGKSTLLRMIAGLEALTAGEIRIGPRVVDSVARGQYVPPERRGVGLVFQSYALWPHMTVEENVEFGLAVRRTPERERKMRVAEVLALLDITGLAGRYPWQISGGQQQRVALARALVVEPEVLLLDEPLSNLDARLRVELRAELKRLHRQLGTTVLYVTHDQLEAMTLGTMVGVMREGVVEEVGEPMAVYREPVNRFVAEFLGSPPINIVEVRGDNVSNLGAALLAFMERTLGRAERRKCGRWESDPRRFDSVETRRRAPGLREAAWRPSCPQAPCGSWVSAFWGRFSMPPAWRNRGRGRVTAGPRGKTSSRSLGTVGVFPGWRRSPPEGDRSGHGSGVARPDGRSPEKGADISMILPPGGMTRRVPVPIRAVVFDLGGTLEEIYYDDEVRLNAARGIHALLQQQGLDPGLSVAALHAMIEAGLAAYQRWRQETELELSAERVWTEFVFPDGLGSRMPRDRLAAVAEDLAFFYENHAYVRRLRSEAPAVLESLREQGFRLAVVSNIVSRRLVPVNLQSYGVAHLFDHVLVSSVLGIRKPHPRIFLEAARRLDLPPAACAFVGDTISRDVAGARRAGYAMAIQIRSFLTDRADGEMATEVPDAVIHDLREVVPLVIRGAPAW